MSKRDDLAALALASLGLPNHVQWWLGAGLSRAEADWALRAGLAWCGVATLSLCHAVGLLLERRWIVARGFVLVPTPLPRVAPHDARRGHILYHVTHQHHAVIADVDARGQWGVVNPNGYGGRVTLSHVDPREYPAGEVTVYDPGDVVSPSTAANVAQPERSGGGAASPDSMTLTQSLLCALPAFQVAA